MLLSVLIHRNSDPTGLVIWCAIGFCAGIALFLYGFRLLQRRRLILEIPFSKIRSASIGMIEISGLATGPYTMVASVDPSVRVNVHDRLRLALNPERLHFFDTRSEAVI